MEIAYFFIKMGFLSIFSIAAVVIVFYLVKNWGAFKKKYLGFEAKFDNLLISQKNVNERQDELNKELLRNVEAQTRTNEAVRDNIIEIRQWLHEKNANDRQVNNRVTGLEKKVEKHEYKIERIEHYIKIPAEKEVNDGCKESN